MCVWQCTSFQQFCLRLTLAELQIPYHMPLTAYQCRLSIKVVSGYCIGQCFSTKVPRLAAKGSAETDQSCLGWNLQLLFYADVAMPLFHSILVIINHIESSYLSIALAYCLLSVTSYVLDHAWQGLVLTCWEPLCDILVLRNHTLATIFMPLCNSITHQAIELDSCSNPQKMRQVF